MTFSPPSKVNSNNNHEILRVLTSGVDRLVLTVDVKWKNENLFNSLSELKEKAKENKSDYPGSIGNEDSFYWKFNMSPSGAKGWEWILKGQEFTLNIGNWLDPISRPSMLIDIGSETLWRVGIRYAIDWIMGLIDSLDGQIATVKPSRVDLCMDVLLDEKLWSQSLIDFCVTRARIFKPFYYSEKLTGIQIGSGKILVRIYDKEHEINTISKKFWMYDIWKLEEIPENKRIIRIEFQIRREVIKQLAIDTTDELFAHIDSLWAYCTMNWLKFQDNPGKHHTQRTTFKLWEEIQNCYMGVQEPSPLIRAKAISIDSERLRHQALGYFTSLIASEAIGMGIEECREDVDFRARLISLIKNSEWLGRDNYEFNEEVKGKIAKYYRAIGKMNEAKAIRIKKGFPTG